MSDSACESRVLAKHTGSVSCFALTPTTESSIEDMMLLVSGTCPLTLCMYSLSVMVWCLTVMRSPHWSPLQYLRTLSAVSRVCRRFSHACCARCRRSESCPGASCLIRRCMELYPESCGMTCDSVGILIYICICMVCVVFCAKIRLFPHRLCCMFPVWHWCGYIKDEVWENICFFAEK